jgi:tripartite-type tricarboxylate transporter receptor subunit TctC
MKISRMAIAALFLAASSATSAVSAPASQTTAFLPYPQRVGTLVTHSSPGSGSDIFLREMVKYLQRYVNATFIVENDEGGSGAKACRNSAAQQRFATTLTHILTVTERWPTPSAIRTGRNFHRSELIYSTAGPYKSLKDVIDHAKTRAAMGASNRIDGASIAEESDRGQNAAVAAGNGGSAMMINVLNGTPDIWAN